MQPLRALHARGAAVASYSEYLNGRVPLPAQGTRLASLGMVPETPRVDVLDTLYVQRPAKESTLRSLVTVLSHRHRPWVVVDYDDDLFNLDRSNPAYGYYRRDDTRAAIRLALRAADVVTTTTEYLAGRLRDEGARTVVVVPNAVPDAHLSRPDGVVDGVLGWAGSVSHARDWCEVPYLGGVAGQHRVARFAVWGMDVGARVGWPTDRYTYTPWVKGHEAYLRGLRMGVGLAPLADVRFNRAKSDLRFVEYAALGVCVVASDVGPYAGSIRHGETGVLVGDRTGVGWCEALDVLLSDPGRARELGTAARASVAMRTVGVASALWETVLTPGAIRI